MQDPLAFLIAATLLLATPGPTNTLLFSAGFQQGIARSAPLLLGEVGGYSLAITVLTLLGGVFSAVPSSGSLLRLVCATYLVYAAVRAWRNAAVASSDVTDVTAARVFTTTLLNPKAMIFAFVIVPHLADARFREAAPYLLALAGLIVGCGFSWIVAGSSIRRHSGLKVSTATIRRATSVVLAIFATWIGAKIATG